MECEAGEASINLQLYLGHHKNPPHSKQPRQSKRPGPLRLRRLAKRSEAQAAANAAQASHKKTTEVAAQATSPNIPTKEADVQAVPKAIEASVQASVPVLTTVETVVQVSSPGNPTKSPSTPGTRPRPIPAAQVRPSLETRSAAQVEHPQRMSPAARYIPASPWTTQMVVNDTVCSDLDYERELVMENQREKDRKDNVRKTLEMIERCIGPPK